ncbi:hypothetical protein [Curtobacterium sp. SGAir0471]|uniref:hypothetical protein n=1 Tax=Curtobacterium sp. SGAir0471 TaxID=2070337 RepID=UPI0015869D68|nr:hypothetical protein [Curtobacterium sp. SGAir0471]
MAVLSHEDDPWAGRRSVRGYPLDELISALQKLIRRCEMEEAILVARELWETGEDVEDKLWERLRVISVEDLGGSEPLVMLEVQTLNYLRTSLPPRSRDRWLMAVQAVRRLAELPKDRSTDDIAAWAILMLTTGRRKPTIPDYALDVHTRRGQLAGKDSLDFLRSSAKVGLQSSSYDDRYWRMLVEAAEEGVWND